MALGTGRRDFLAAISSVGLVGIAGCSGGGGNGATPTESPTPTPNQEAVEHYEAAVEVLVDTKETLDEWADSSFEPEMVGALQGEVSSAREDLTAAADAADPSGTLIVQINQAKLVANFQVLSLAYYEAVNAFFQVVSEASNLGDNELHQRAADTYAEAREVLDSARGVIEDMGTTIDEMDTEALAEPELEYTGEPLDHLDLGDMRAIDAAGRYATANENIHLAFVQLETGQEHYENEEFTAAREAWETGRQRTEDSKSAFEDTLDNEFTPQNLRQDSINKLGATETIIEAYEKLIEAATEAEAGNLRNANSLINEGFNILSQL